MFANPRYSLKTAPVFTDSARWASEGEGLYVTGLRPAIMNDGDEPPKALIQLDMFSIPIEDFTEGTSWKDTYYDLSGCVCLTPRDTIELIAHLNRLLAELFNDHNYIKNERMEKWEKEERKAKKKAKGDPAKQKRGTAGKRRRQK